MDPMVPVHPVITMFRPLKLLQKEKSSEYISLLNSSGPFPPIGVIAMPAVLLLEPVKAPIKPSKRPDGYPGAFGREIFDGFLFILI